MAVLASDGNVSVYVNGELKSSVGESVERLGIQSIGNLVDGGGRFSNALMTSGFTQERISAEIKRCMVTAMVILELILHAGRSSL